jgi:hypothetical protein
MFSRMAGVRTVSFGSVILESVKLESAGVNAPETMFPSFGCNEFDLFQPDYFDLDSGTFGRDLIHDRSQRPLAGSNTRFAGSDVLLAPAWGSTPDNTENRGVLRYPDGTCTATAHQLEVVPSRSKHVLQFFIEGTELKARPLPCRDTGRAVTARFIGMVSNQLRF